MSRDLTATPPRATDYFLCGWRVRSAVPLPEVAPWTGDDRTPDVTVRFGSVPDLTDIVGKPGVVQVGRDGACRIEPEGIGRFLILGGREVTVEADGPIDTPEIRAWLLGPVMGILCHQRGLFPLHAACIRIGDGAIAFAGRAGAGKSTLAAALVRRGHALIADDVCVIDPAAPSGPRVLPSFPRLKLREDALQALGISDAGLVRSGSGKRKFDFLAAGSFDPAPVRLRAIYVLGRAGPGQPRHIRCEAGAPAVVTLSNEIYRRPIGFHLGRKTALLAEALCVAAAVPVCRLPVGHDLRRIDATAARVEAHVASLGPDPHMPRFMMPRPAFLPPMSPPGEPSS
jgi:hypothetical protein